MNREIKFRGNDEQGRWWKGDLRHTMMELGKPHCRIVNVDKDDYDRLQEKWSDPIQEDTIGQFTGVTDGDGREIYEGDIVAIYQEEHCTFKGKVEYLCGDFIVNNKDGLITHLSKKPWQVIGNIHDNPELLEGGEK